MSIIRAMFSSSTGLRRFPPNSDSQSLVPSSGGAREVHAMGKLRTEQPDLKPLACRRASWASVGLRLWLMLLLLASSSPVSAQLLLPPYPDPTWNCDAPGDELLEITDCIGAANNTDNPTHLNVDGSLQRCQDYFGFDLYETLEYRGDPTPCDPSMNSPTGACDADIYKYRTGADDFFFYFEVETVETNDYDDTGTSRDFVFVIDADFATEGGPREDLYYFYDTDAAHVVTNANNCSDDVAGGQTGLADDGGGNWQAAGESSPIVAHRDENPDTSPEDQMGSTNPLLCDKPGQGGCASPDGDNPGFSSD